MKLFLLLLLSNPLQLLSQQYIQWDSHFDGVSSGQDFGRSFVLDNSGNSYMVGSSSGSGTGMDIVIVKFDPLGNQLWESTFNGADNGADWGYAIAIDDMSNLFVTGETQTLSNASDFVTLKLDSNGSVLWTKTYDGTNNSTDAAVDICLDDNGNVFVTGKSSGVGSLDDYLTIKYDNLGNELWVKRYNGTGNDIDDARTISSDNAGNVYVSGGSVGDTTDYDFVTIKYDGLGNQLWLARYNGPGNGYDLVFYQGSLLTDTLVY